MRFNHWNGVQIRPNTFLDYVWIMSKSVSLSDPGLLIFLWQLPLSSSSVSSSLSHFKQWPFAFQLSRLSWCCFVGAFADSVPLKSCDTPFYPIPKFGLCFTRKFFCLMCNHVWRFLELNTETALFTFLYLLHYEQVFVICPFLVAVFANWALDVRQNCPHMVALSQDLIKQVWKNIFWAIQFLRLSYRTLGEQRFKMFGSRFVFNYPDWVWGQLKR